MVSHQLIARSMYRSTSRLMSTSFGNTNIFVWKVLNSFTELCGTLLNEIYLYRLLIGNSICLQTFHKNASWWIVKIGKILDHNYI